MKLPLQVNVLSKNLIETCKIHPVLTLVSFLTSTYLAVLVEMPTQETPVWVPRLTMGLFFWLLSCFSIALTRLALKLPPSLEIRAGFFAAALSGAVVWFVPDFDRSNSQLRYLLSCLVPVATAGSLLFSLRDDEGDQRTFVLKLLSAVFMAGLLSTAAWLLGSGALYGIHALLFEVTRLGKHLTAFACVTYLFASPLLVVLFLRTAEGLHSLWERLLQTLSKNVMLPAILLYEVILALYSLKIAITGTMPRGVVSLLVTVCVLLAIAVNTLLPPPHSKGWRSLRRSLFVGLFPFLGFLWYAIYERISPYGFTSERYLLTMAACCLTATTLWAVARREHVLPFFSATLAVGALISLAGPIGFEAVSERSQWKRLLDTLQSAQLLHDGTWVTSLSQPEWEIRKKLTESLAWFDANSRRDRVSGLLTADAQELWNKPPDCTTPYRCRRAISLNGDALLKHLGITPIRSWERSEPDIDFTDNDYPLHGVHPAGDRTFVGWISCEGETTHFSLDGSRPSKGSALEPRELSGLTLSAGCSRLTVSREGRTACELTNLFSAIDDFNGQEIPAPMLVFRATGPECDLRLLITSLKMAKTSGRRIEGRTTLRGTVWVEFKE